MPCPVDYDPSEFNEDEPDEGVRDEDVERAKPRIEEIIAQVRVATDRELKVRLEKEFFPWIIGRALNTMVREGLVRRVGYAGRRTAGKRIPESFFTLYGTPYSKIVGILEEKRTASRDINAILTAHAPAGTHAEDLFERAFLELGFKIHDRDASKFRGREVTGGVEGKQLPNLDFIIEKDKVIYGVDVKNWIKYEYSTRFQVIRKVGLALDLEIVPFIMARYIDRDTIYKQVYLKGGVCYPYGTLLVPPDYESVADRVGSLMGYPVIAVDALPVYKVKWIQKLHMGFIARQGT